MIPSEIEGKPVTEIGESAFQACESLTRVTIPDTVQTLGKYVFWGCTKLQDVTLPKTLSAISDGCFRFCSALAELDIPETVEYIGIDALGSTVWLKQRQAENPLVQVNHILVNATACTDSRVVIPNGVKQIGPYAFNSTAVTEGVIPESVERIGWGAFWNCQSLKKLNLPANLTQIEESAFCNCAALQELEIPAGVTRIFDNTFSGCTSLKQITILGNLTQIGTVAFYNCTSLTDVYTAMTETAWKAVYIAQKNEPLEQAAMHYDIFAGLLLGDMDGSGTLDSTDVFYLMLGIAKSAGGLSPDSTAAAGRILRMCSISCCILRRTAQGFLPRGKISWDNQEIFLAFFSVMWYNRIGLSGRFRAVRYPEKQRYLPFLPEIYDFARNIDNGSH